MTNFERLCKENKRIRRELTEHYSPSEADMQELKHGHWIVEKDEYEICATEFTCSECGETFCSSEMTDEGMLEMMKYCMNCGAKMDEELREEDKGD